MNRAKIHLSEEELQLLQNAEWVLTKNKIISKVYDLFGMVAEQMQTIIQSEPLPEGIAAGTPKISRGENYNGLPYVMLDYPRVFGKEDIFAIRSFFWWGNYFSITLHLKGAYKRMFVDVIQKKVPLLATNHFFISIADDEWKHEIDEHAYMLLQNVSTDDIRRLLHRHDHLKISSMISFAEWADAGKRFVELFGILLKTISDDR
ncbi:MAG: hypothetical protein ABUT20_26940 [Bacteroidota bacterium]